MTNAEKIVDELDYAEQLLNPIWEEALNARDSANKALEAIRLMREKITARRLLILREATQ